MADFSLTEQEQKLYERAMKFARTEIVPRAIELDQANEVPIDICQKAYEAGFMNLHIPKEAGGPHNTLFEETLIYEAMGYGDPGVATSINVNNLAFAPLVIGATIEQLQKYVKPLVTGGKVKFGAFCLTEREAGSDASATKTMAAKDTGIPQKNICRVKRKLEKANRLWEIKHGKCKVTGYMAMYLTTNKELLPPEIEFQLQLF